MSQRADDEKELHSTALQNVKSILQARLRAEAELVEAKEALEVRAGELARSLSALRATLESTTDAILVTGPGGEIFDYNEKLAEIWSSARAPLAAKDKAATWQTIARQLADPARFKVRTAEIEASATESFDQLELADGRVLELFSTARVMSDALVGRVWSFRDITEHKLHEAALRSSHAQFSSIIYHSPVGILLVDTDLRLRQVNPIAQPMLGGIEPLLGRELSDVLALLWREPIPNTILGHFRATLLTGEPKVLRDFSAIRKDRDVEEHYDWMLHRIPLPDGRQGVVCYLIDITQHVRARDALRDGERRVRATFEQAAVGMTVAGLDGRFLQVNQKFTRMLGYSVEEICGRTLLDITLPEDLPRAREQGARLLAGEISEYAGEQRYVRKDGRAVWTLTTVAMLRTEAGVPERFVAVVEDISERKRAEEAVRESSERLQLALSAAHLDDWSWDAASDALTFGDRTAGLLGLPLGTPTTWAAMYDRLHVDDRDRVREAFESALRERSDYDVEYRVKRTSGDEVWLAAKGRGVYAADGSTKGMIGVVQDVSERKRLEIVQERLAAVVESSDDAIVSKDLDGTIRSWNTGAERIFGYTAAEMIGTSILRLIPPELHEEERLILERQRKGERVDHYETVRVTKTGQRLDISLTVSPMRDSTGRIVGASKVARDISARKRAEAELRRNEEELRALADSMPNLAWMANADGHVFWYNREWYEYTGTTFEQMEGWGWQSVHDETILPRVLTSWRESLRTGTPFEMEYPLRGADQKFRWFLTRVRPIRNASGRVIRWFGTNTDVDEVKRAREALWDESRLLNLLNETGKTIAGDLDTETLVQSVTDAATQLSGAEFGAFFYNTVDDKGESLLLFTLSGAKREDFEKFASPRATPLFAPTFTGEGTIRLDDVLADERYGKWAPHFGMPEGHLPVRSYLAAPVVSRTGEVIGGLFFGHSTPGVFTERIERIITGIAAQAAVAIDNARLYERVKRAAEDRQELLDAERSARAEAERVSLMKDEFLATLSHELRTPLHAILGWSQVLRMQGHADAEVLEGLSVIDRNAKMQARLIEDLLDMSRIVSGKIRLEVQPVDVQDVVKAAIASIRQVADAKSIRIHVVLDPMAGPVWGDPSRLQQCFWNLLSNAVKFTPKGGRVQVTLARINSHIELTVADNGQGISPEFLPHVFERFRQADASTTRQHGGLGLGLSILKSLVEMHGGLVRADSPGVGQGATFTIELPVMVVGGKINERRRVHPMTRPVNEAPMDHPSLRGIKVLAIDDESDARDLVQRVLKDCGAIVFVASSARAGLEILRREKLDIVISDIGMPDDDGYSFIREVRRLPPEQGGRVPAVALSAFARPEDRTRALRSGYQIHLSKPVEPTELTAVIASLAMRNLAQND